MITAKLALMLRELASPTQREAKKWNLQLRDLVN